MEARHEEQLSECAMGMQINDTWASLNVKEECYTKQLFRNRIAHHIM